jgi:hypothetical protein
MNSIIDNNAHKQLLLQDFIQRAAFHHAMWFNQVEKYFGKERAYQILSQVFKQSAEIQTRRIQKTLNSEPNNIDTLMESVALNWLANDGVWFQAVEFSSGMKDAKYCNDKTWADFSPFEAWSIRQFLGLEENSGLEGLKNAMFYRLYATINRQSIVEETPTSFVFQMDDCRVQSARKRKGLDDYPCKSAGIVEYTEFAKAIDSRIITECVSCPPDAHPANYFCAWRFSI